MGTPNFSRRSSFWSLDKSTAKVRTGPDRLSRGHKGMSKTTGSSGQLPSFLCSLQIHTEGSQETVTLRTNCRDWQAYRYVRF
jgi:hypothetical protein